MKKLLFLTALLALLLALPAVAHKINLFAYAEKGTIYTESYFPDGHPVKGGKLLVLDSSDQQLLTGTTDQEGRFNFPIPKVDDLRIVIQTTMGHKYDFILKRSALAAGQ